MNGSFLSMGIEHALERWAKAAPVGVLYLETGANIHLENHGFAVPGDRHIDAEVAQGEGTGGLPRYLQHPVPRGDL
jgi:hypothetical protein